MEKHLHGMSIFLLFTLFACTIKQDETKNQSIFSNQTVTNELLRVGDLIEKEKVTSQDFSRLENLLKSDKHAEDELQEVEIMVGYGEYKHAGHGIGLLLYYMATKTDLLCPGHALSHYYIYLKHGDKSRAGSSFAEAKEQLPAWIQYAKEYRIHYQENFNATLENMTKSISKIDAGITSATDEEINSLSEAFCASQ